MEKEINNTSVPFIDTLDAALASCNRLAMIGDLLRAVSQPVELSDETLRIAGDTIDQEADRLKGTLQALIDQRQGQSST